ncbi:MAG: hypothetical protein R2733_17970 [Acidimicrobiales bacterium]
MLRFVKKDVRSIYEVDGSDDASIAPLHGRRSWTRGSTTIAGEPIEFESGGRGQVSVVRAGSVVAQGAMERTEHRTTWDGPEIVSRRKGRRQFVAESDGRQVGTVDLVGVAGRRIEADLPTDLPIEVRLLISFMAIGAWNRAANSAL